MIWSYTLDDANAAVNALNVGDSLIDTITVLTVDGTSQDITLTIQGADDAVVISGDTSGTVTEDTGMAATGTLTATDPDDANGFQPNAGLVGSYGTCHASMPAGDWSYTLDDANATVNALNVGDSLIDTITVLTVDGTSQDITLTIQGADDAVVISGDTSGTVTEDTGVAATGTLTATDPDDANGFQPNAGLVGSYGTASINAAGDWSYTLDDANAAVNALNVGDSLIDTITVLTVDGTSQDITLTIQGADDAPVIGGGTTGTVTEDTGVAATGTLTATDPDDPDGFQPNAGLVGTYGTATIDAAGDWIYTLDDANAAVNALQRGRFADRHDHGPHRRRHNAGHHPHDQRCQRRAGDRWHHYRHGLRGYGCGRDGHTDGHRPRRYERLPGERGSGGQLRDGQHQCGGRLELHAR